MFHRRNAVLVCCACLLIAIPAYAGEVSLNGLTLHYPDNGANGPISVAYRGRKVVDDNWYYCVGTGQQTAVENFRSRGKVVSASVTATPDGGKTLHLQRLTDLAAQPDIGTFDLTYELRPDAPVIYHTATFTPRQRLQLRSCQFFVSTSRPVPATNEFRFLEDTWQTAGKPPVTQASYGRIPFPVGHPCLAIEQQKTGLADVVLGTLPEDVRSLEFSLDFTRFELNRAGGDITTDEPLREFAWLGFGLDRDGMVSQQKLFEKTFHRPERSGEAVTPIPNLTQPPPPPTYGVGIKQTGENWDVSAGDFRITINAATGALTQFATNGRQTLAAPGGMNFVRWPDKQTIGPAGGVTSVTSSGSLRFTWRRDGLTVKHTITPRQGCVLWEITISNAAAANLLVEARLSLPVNLGDQPWFFFNGQRLEQVSRTTRDAETTTLIPGGTLSQGIFPAVCLHNRKTGLALGLQPMDIESFYGARVRPALGPLDTLQYAVRAAIPPHGSRTVRFLLFATDPNWSWRSMIDRYWRLFPDVFAAPKRDDIWGLYSASSPEYIATVGDEFIDLCRRFHVGAMELYAPFNKTGDFYPDAEPAYERGKFVLNRSQMRQAYETADIACCNLSYLIPTKCERSLAKEKYADSIIRLADGAPFLEDYWDVMGGGHEKLAAMFAWGDSFGENLRRELREVVANYKPDGFYMDNGAFLWQDYGRKTEWSTFDDDGRIYTNAGIAYAKLLDDLRDFAPDMQRNPGEFIQYFSGFRAKSYLTNQPDVQPFYTRTHRLIMGYKPIFPDHPDRITKARLFDALELGGLPWLAGFRHDREALAAEWGPVAVTLARAGWQPITAAVSSSPIVRVERFGDGAETLFTVRNMDSAPATVELTLAGKHPQLCEFRNRVPLSPRIDDKAATTHVALTLPGSELVVLRVTPPRHEEREWPTVTFLHDAAPTSIVASDAVAEAHTARRIKGFLELQAELLGKKGQVEIIASEGNAKLANRVLVQKAPESSLTARDAHTLLLAGPDEAAMKQLLDAYLATIQIPLSKAPAQWKLAAP